MNSIFQFVIANEWGEEEDVASHKDMIIAEDAVGALLSRKADVTGLEATALYAQLAVLCVSLFCKRGWSEAYDYPSMQM